MKVEHIREAGCAKDFFHSFFIFIKVYKNCGKFSLILAQDQKYGAISENRTHYQLSTSLSLLILLYTRHLDIIIVASFGHFLKIWFHFFMSSSTVLFLLDGSGCSFILLDYFSLVKLGFFSVYNFSTEHSPAIFFFFLSIWY